MGSTCGYFVTILGWERASGATLVALVVYGRSRVGKWVVVVDDGMVVVGAAWRKNNKF